jgi:signal transduction histidine kinase
MPRQAGFAHQCSIGYLRLTKISFEYRKRQQVCTFIQPAQRHGLTLIVSVHFQLGIRMRLASFIRANTTAIVKEWEGFAQRLIPAAEHMSPRTLRDHIVEILDFIVEDIETPQTDCEQIQKSRGQKPKSSRESSAETHAALRRVGGFDMDQMVSEFRALRASVTKLWRAQLKEPTNLDVSDLTRFNESIDQELNEAIGYYSSKLDHSRDLFLGVLGHDLRNPIGAMRMSAQLTLQIGPLSETQTMLVSQVITSAGRATELLDDLLDLTRARLGSGSSILKVPMDIAFVGRQFVDEMRVMHPGRKFTLEISGDTEGRWDRPRVGQVFSNLLGNAVQYGFTDLPINVTIKGESEEVILSVHNDGIPIPLDVIGKIFDSLTRGEGGDGQNPCDRRNLGLGLFITKEIVSAHGGRVDVTSSEKSGTVFTARFPRCAVAGPEGQAAENG